MSTRELIKKEIDIMPESAFVAFEQMFAAFFSYVKQTNNEFDPFWSEKQQNYLKKSLSDYENGITMPVYKTFEELEAYES